MCGENRTHGFGREGWNGNIPLDSIPRLYAVLRDLNGMAPKVLNAVECLVLGGDRVAG